MYCLDPKTNRMTYKEYLISNFKGVTLDLRVIPTKDLLEMVKDTDLETYKIKIELSKRDPIYKALFEEL